MRALILLSIMTALFPNLHPLLHPNPLHPLHSRWPRLHLLKRPTHYYPPLRRRRLYHLPPHRLFLRPLQYARNTRRIPRRHRRGGFHRLHHSSRNHLWQSLRHSRRLCGLHFCGYAASTVFPCVEHEWYGEYEASGPLNVVLGGAPGLLLGAWIYPAGEVGRG